MHEGFARPTGNATFKKLGAKRAPLSWRLHNALRFGFIRGWLAVNVVAPFARAWGLTTMTSELAIRVRTASGEWIDYGVVGYRVITNAGVAFLVDDWDVNTASSTNDITTLRYHGIGTTNTAEAVGDTALAAESTTALNPDSTRATGTQSQPSANVLQSVGTLTADASIAAVEHGLFSQAATGGGTLWDRTVFTVINLASGDSLQATYSCTVSAGG